MSRLDDAYSLYWSAERAEEGRIACLEIILYGGENPYGQGRWRDWIAMMLRRLAERIDR